MSELMLGVNHVILQWARELSGYTAEEAARNVTSKKEMLELWEAGDAYPTYRQLEKLSVKYGRPLALFFFPEPPNEPNPTHEFRTVPNAELNKLPPSVLKLIRQAYSRRISLQELTGGRNDLLADIFRGNGFTPESPPREAAQQVREAIGVSVVEQSRWPSEDAALKSWRTAIQAAGVYVFKEAFFSEETDGFSIFDEIFPLIYLNNSQFKHRQIFTLAHELGHILLGNSGITQDDHKYVSKLKGYSRSVENFCNRFAAEFLMPFDDFREEVERTHPAVSTLQIINSLSRRYKVSRESVLVRMSKLEFISREELRELQPLMKRKPKKRKSTGGDHYRKVEIYLGNRYIDLALGQYYAGNCTASQLADHLDIKANQVPEFEAHIVSG